MLTRDKDIAGLSKRVDEVINKAIENNKIIGTVTLICKDGNLIYKNVAGYAGEEKQNGAGLDISPCICYKTNRFCSSFSFGLKK